MPAPRAVGRIRSGRYLRNPGPEHRKIFPGPERFSLRAEEQHRHAPQASVGCYDEWNIFVLEQGITIVCCRCGNLHLCKFEVRVVRPIIKRLAVLDFA